MKARILTILKMQTAPSELTVALITIGWGLWIINPKRDTFINPVYGAMTGLFSMITTHLPSLELLWGSIFLVIGVAQLYSTLWLSLKIRARMILLSCMLWSYVVWMFIGYDMSITGAPTYAILVLVSLWVYINLWITRLSP